MKKTLYSLLILLVGAIQTTNAQWSKGFKTNEVSLSYGYLSNIKFVDSYTEVDATSLATKIGYVSTDNLKTIGSINAQLLHRNRKWLSFGIGLTYEATTQDCYNNKKEKAEWVVTRYGEMTSRYISAMPTFRFNWLIYRSFTIYSKIAGGLCFMVHSYKDTSNNGDIIEGKKKHGGSYQLSPFGIQIGSKDIVGFLELGFGNEGVAQAGVAYKFGY